VFLHVIAQLQPGIDFLIRENIRSVLVITLDSWKVYNHHTVCGLHFENHYFAANNKLKNTAVPTLRIPYSKFNDIYIKCHVYILLF
jgi:hypothetical protein